MKRGKQKKRGYKWFNKTRNRELLIRQPNWNCSLIIEKCINNLFYFFFSFSFQYMLIDFVPIPFWYPIFNSKESKRDRLCYIFGLVFISIVFSNWNGRCRVDDLIFMYFYIIFLFFCFCIFISIFLLCGAHSGIKFIDFHFSLTFQSIQTLMNTCTVFFCFFYFYFFIWRNKYIIFALHCVVVFSMIRRALIDFMK